MLLPLIFQNLEAGEQPQPEESEREAALTAHGGRRRVRRLPDLYVASAVTEVYAAAGFSVVNVDEPSIGVATPIYSLLTRAGSQRLGVVAGSAQVSVDPCPDIAVRATSVRMACGAGRMSVVVDMPTRMVTAVAVSSSAYVGAAKVRRRKYVSAAPITKPVRRWRLGAAA